MEEASSSSTELAAAGIDMEDVAAVLEAEGVASFAKSFDELMQAYRQGQRAPGPA